MSMTPGPWFKTKDSDYNDVARIGMAWIIGTKLPLSEMGDVDDDARAIAALPDLVEALKRADIALRFAAEALDSPAMKDDVAFVRAALNKAGVTHD